MRHSTILFLTIILLTACESNVQDHPIFSFYPPRSVFEKGYVSKYYQHYYPANANKDAITKIEYTKYLQTADDRYRTETYNAGFELETVRHYLIQGDTVLMEKSYEIDRSNPEDTTITTILSGTTSVWNGEMKEPFQVRYTYDDIAYAYKELQVSVKDSIMMEKPAKVFVNTWEYVDLETDSVIRQGSSRSFYVQDIGFFSQNRKTSDFSLEVELIEQMPLGEFEKRADHEQHRVAWIDPQETLSEDTDFTLCGHEKDIADYYNSTPDGRYLHGKYALLDTVYGHLDPSKLTGQDGSLVFRFVVNCEGRPGRFIAEGYDAGYQKVEFQQETIDHLFEIVKKLKEWRPVVIREEARDAYFYLNIKIEKGEIIDILP
ncbi:MAG: hypothetical protein AAGA66_07215 [Bacteroidota bacterium]